MRRLFLTIALAALAYKLGLPKKYTRKTVHILVGFEWVILYHFMGAGVHFLAVCLLFLIILAASYKLRLMPMISSDADNAPGTVYYAVAMSGVALVGCFIPEIMLPFGIGVFCTSFGDGLAGAVGQAVKKGKYNPKLYGEKSLVGTLTNFAVSFGGAFVLSEIYGMGITVWECAAIGILSVQLELVTTGGLDNVTITWGTAALAFGFMHFITIEEYIVPILMTVPIIMLVRMKRALTRWGLVGALVLDALVSIAFGNFGFVILSTFFIGSIIIDKIKKRTKNKGSLTVEAKNDYRDLMQVMANGLVAGISATAFIITGKSLFVIPFVACIAEAFADTAASGIGIFATKTYDPFRAKRCEPGISGGMSVIGTLASLVASFAVALIALMFGRSGFGINAFFIAGFCGFCGALFDSLLGSLLQVKYRCSVCGSITEKEEHCGLPTVRSSGFAAIDNDTVNIISCAFSAVLAIAITTLA